MEQPFETKKNPKWKQQTANVIKRTKFFFLQELSQIFTRIMACVLHTSQWKQLQITTPLCFHFKDIVFYCFFCDELSLKRG